MTEPQFTKTGFVKAFVLPALFAFLLPAVGLWFARHVTADYDARVVQSALSAIAADTTATPEMKARATAFYTSVPASLACTGARPELDGFKSDLGETCGDLRQFAWMERIAELCLLLGGLALLVALGCVAVSLASQRAMYAAFLVGWNGLKAVSLFLVLGQGTLAVLLSYWMPAFWTQRYSPKLVGVMGLLSLVAVWLLVKAIFKRVDPKTAADGVVLEDARAPKLWAHVRSVCAKLGTPPPDQILVGVDDNFFVTENPITASGRELTGRTLFVSLPLLRHLEKEEADAVLAHELAHFSGNDTRYTKKLSPLVSRYVEYLGALQAGVVSIPIYYFMLFFFTLSQLSLKRMSRQREHRADKIAAEATSPEDLGRALLKVVAYSSYRARIEKALFAENRPRDDLGIGVRVSTGFNSYVVSSDLDADLAATSFPHPFDSHPPLAARLQAVNAHIPVETYDALLSIAALRSWTTAIDGASDIERELWAAYERRFAAVHEESLAYRLGPANDEERAIVLKYFPDVELVNKKGTARVCLNFTGVAFTDWPEKVPFSTIRSFAVKGKTLVVEHLPAGAAKPQKLKLPIGDFAAPNDVLARIHHYHQRDAVMRQLKPS